MAAFIVPSHSCSISILQPFTGPRRRADRGGWQTFPVPDSLLWCCAPSHAYCYLSAWVMLGDKTLAKTLTVSRPLQSECWPRCNSLTVWHRPTRKLRPRDENRSRLPQHRLTCGHAAILPPVFVLLLVAILPYPTGYPNLNQCIIPEQELNPKETPPKNLLIATPSSSLLSFGNNT